MASTPKRPRYKSPTLDLHISAERWEEAKNSNSGGCLLAEAIKRQYPHLTKVMVDMATIRASDRKLGVRYMWLTPGPGQHILLALDQGWRQPTEQIIIKRAVKVTPIIRSPKETAKIAVKRDERRAELEAKVESGEQLTAPETRALTKLKRPYKPVKRPASRGKAEANREGIISGGMPSMQGRAHPNLLRGYDRHFGAKIADPGVAFQEAVDQAVAQRLAEKENGEAA